MSVASRLLPLAAVLVAACSTDDPAAPSTDPNGTLRGTVTVVGDPAPPSAGSRVYLLADPDAPRSAAVRTGTLEGGPRVYTFALDAVPAGRYYVQACLQLGSSTGCTFYVRTVGEEPAPVDVRPGAVTELAVRF